MRLNFPIYESLGTLTKTVTTIIGTLISWPLDGVELHVLDWRWRETQTFTAQRLVLWKLTLVQVFVQRLGGRAGEAGRGDRHLWEPGGRERYSPKLERRSKLSEVTAYWEKEGQVCWKWGKYWKTITPEETEPWSCRLPASLYSCVPALVLKQQHLWDAKETYKLHSGGGGGSTNQHPKGVCETPRSDVAPGIPTENNLLQPSVIIVQPPR